MEARAAPARVALESMAGGVCAGVGFRRLFDAGMLRWRRRRNARIARKRYSPADDEPRLYIPSGMRDRLECKASALDQRVGRSTLLGSRHCNLTARNTTVMRRNRRFLETQTRSCPTGRGRRQSRRGKGEWMEIAQAGLVKPISMRRIGGPHDISMIGMQ